MMSDTTITIQKLVEQLYKEMRALSSLFMTLPDNFISDFESNALEISEARDKEIREQIDRIEQKLNEISTNDTQTEPLNQDSMNKTMVDIMVEYNFIHAAIMLRSESKGSRDYTMGLNKIKTAFKNFAGAIDKYNEIATSKNWPMVQSLNESLSIAQQSTLLEEIEEERKRSKTNDR